MCDHPLEEHREIRDSDHPGRCQFDAIEILENSKKCIDGCMAVALEEFGIGPDQVEAIGITNQRETVIAFDCETGIPLYDAIVWHDNRTHEICERLRRKDGSDKIQQISGLPISIYFSAVKMRWLIEEVDKVKEAVENGRARFGTVDSWLVWNFTAENLFVTDVTNAGRTSLMHITDLKWDPTLLSFFGINGSLLPDIRSSSEVYGTMACTKLKGTRIAGVIGDQQAALIGQGCFFEGEGKTTYGSGAFLIVNTGLSPKFSKHGLLTTPAFKFKDEPCVYSLEGSVPIAGEAVKWFKNTFNVIKKAAEIEALASGVDDSGDVSFVPALSGLFAPHWREDARGAILGLTLSTTAANIARATHEGIVFQVDEVIKAANQDMGSDLPVLKVDGGASNNDLLMQMQADITGTEVVRPHMLETTALGAAFVAGRAVNIFKSIDDFKENLKLNPPEKFQPKLSEEAREAKLKRWKMAFERSLGWIVDGDASDVDGQTTWQRLAKLAPSRDAVGGAVLGASLALLAMFLARRSSSAN